MAGNLGPGAVDIVEIILGQKEAAKLKKVPLVSGASNGFKRHPEGLGSGPAAASMFSRRNRPCLPFYCLQGKEGPEAARPLRAEWLDRRPCQDRGRRSVMSDFSETERPGYQCLTNNNLEGNSHFFRWSVTYSLIRTMQQV